MEITRHFTATTFVVYKDKLLLHFHKKLSIWLPPGGHIDRDELPEEAAVREVKEETGLTVQLYNNDKSLLDGSDARQLIRPQFVVLEDINAFHQHIDSVYVAFVESDMDVRPGDGESKEWRWISADELDSLQTKENVKILGKKVLSFIC